MKKAFALILALAMVMSLAAVSFAAGMSLEAASDDDEVAGKLIAVDPNLWKYSSDTKSLTMAEDGKMYYGNTLYIVLVDNDDTTEDETAFYVTEDKTVSNLKLSTDWDEGKDAVKSVGIVKKKVNTTSGVQSIYMIAIATNSLNADETEVSGTIALKGKSGTEGTAAEKKVDAEIDVEFTLNYRTGDCDDDSASVEDDGNVYYYNVEDTEEEEFEIDFGGVATVIANVKTQDELYLSLDTDVIDEIDDAYPDADLEYVAMTGSFKKTAEVTVYADEGTYLYEVVDGELVAVDAEYDEWEEAFTFKTKKLGTYVISDVELDVTADVVVTNPSTGAAA